MTSSNMPHLAGGYLSRRGDLSPSTEAIDREKKMPIYAREGVTRAWLIDTMKRTLEAYVLEGRRWIDGCVWSNDAKVRVAPFDAVELDLAVLWG